MLINQLATPGLGSIIARRFVAGTIQLLLAFAGFGLLIGWFVQLMFRIYRRMSDLPVEPARFPWMGTAGLIAFGAAWLLSGITSLSLLLEARSNRTPAAGKKPPVIRPGTA